VGATAMTPAQNAEWKPGAQDAPDIQGIVVSAYPKMLAAVFVMLKFPDPSGGKLKGWLQNIAQHITDATGEQATCVHLAISAEGLRAIGVDKNVIATFSLPFQEGITFGDRPRFLGDVDSQAPATWAWSDCGGDRNCVHAQLMLYAEDESKLLNLLARETEILEHFDITSLGQMLLRVNLDREGRRHEHFGFADGISQPILVDGDKVPADKRALHEISAGEVVLGQTNTYGVPAPGPVVPASVSAARHLKKAALQGFLDLGRNGTYVVIRQLKQDVAAFWNNMKTEAVNLVDDADRPATAEWLAEKAVGRTRTGEMLRPGGSTSGNDMTFFKEDRAGMGCPLTSHVRRANPRDGLVIYINIGLY
jgi:deferrochelatase/peroxidase EfeB